MRVGNPVAYATFGILTALALLAPGRAHGQAPPGPLPSLNSPPGQQTPEPQPESPRKPKPPAVQPRTTLAGGWRLNGDQSDDPRQRVRVAERGTGNYPGGGNPGGGYPGGYPGSYPRGPWGGSPFPGGGGRGGPGYGGQDLEDNPRLQPLLRPADSMTIELTGAEIDVSGDRGQKLVMYTDGRKLSKPTNDREEVAAHWDGSQLVSDEKSPVSGKMSRIFELSHDGRQLFETLHIDTGRSETPIVIRYVYDIPAASISNRESNREDSDPNRPVLKRHTDEDTGPSQ